MVATIFLVSALIRATASFGTPVGPTNTNQVAASKPDVVLVDVWLGEESGLELARRLVEGGEAHGAPVVLISTRGEAEVADLIAGSPAAGFVSKAELSAAAIRRLVEDRSG